MAVLTDSNSNSRDSDRVRVVVTGLGTITPIGNQVAEFWTNLVAGKNGVSHIGRFDASEYPSRIAAEIKGFAPEDHFERKDLKKLDDFVRYAIVAAREAWHDAGLAGASDATDQAGVFIGNAMGGIQTVCEQFAILTAKGPGRVSPFMVPKLISSMAAGMVSIDLGLRGPNLCLVTACASAGHAIGEALRAIRCGDAKVIVAGGSESLITPLVVAAFASMHALSTRNDDPEGASRPFDAERDGFVMGEGAGMLVLEEVEHARARGAQIYCELAGYGYSGDAYHMTAPSPNGDGAVRAMRMALRDARIPSEAVQYVNAHGTSTPLNDAIETEAIKTVFGSHSTSLMTSSNKSCIGHLLGAAAAVEAVATVKTLCEHLVPPTINYHTPDPDCDLDYVQNSARPAAVDCAISNSFGFGGHNCVLCFRRYHRQSPTQPGE